jgi:hypothetical protein
MIKTSIEPTIIMVNSSAAKRILVMQDLPELKPNTKYLLTFYIKTKDNITTKYFKQLEVYLKSQLVKLNVTGIDIEIDKLHKSNTDNLLKL